MANHKSAIKRNRQSELRRARNKANRTRVKNMVRAIDEAITQNSVEDAQAALKAAVPVIQRASVKGTIHKRTASRKVSRLTKRVNTFVSGTESVA